MTSIISYNKVTMENIECNWELSEIGYTLFDGIL